MVIEDYVEFGIPLVDIALEYGEKLVTGLIGNEIVTFLKK